MDSEILVPIITALSALLGGGLTAYVQSRSQGRAHRFQQDVEAIKHRRERLSKQQSDVAQRLVNAHKLLSKTAREFSLTRLDILWRKNMTDLEFDGHYLAACADMDELRALIDLYEPQLSESVEEIHGQMNLVWGYFKEVLARTARGEPIHELDSMYGKAHAASVNIGRIVAHVKSRLVERAGKVQTLDPD